MIDRDGGEGSNNPDAKPKNIKLPPKDILVLDIGLQAARKMKKFSSQTYFNRSVNFTWQYDPKDFVDDAKIKDDDQVILNKKIENFIDTVAPRIEEALQSNELINVFQDDFECLGEKNEEGASKSVLINNEALPFIDIDHSRNKMVSSITFHPTNPFLCALSLIYNLDFDK